MFQIVCRPRVLTDISEADAPLDLATFDLIKERLLCPICTDVFKNPYNVRQCGHKFCQTCIEDFNRLYKKECPSCRTNIGSRRSLRRDTVLTELLGKLITDTDKFNAIEERRRESQLRGAAQVYSRQ